MSRSALAEAVGVSPHTVGQWERYGVVPRADEVQAAVAEVLGYWVWPGDDQREESWPTKKRKPGQRNNAIL